MANKKDPAALVYIDKWIASTRGMKAEFRAWYFDLILYQFDKGSIPNDPDEIAGICRVRPSEYQVYNQMVDQVVNQKFIKQADGTLINEAADEIITARKQFKDKRTLSSNIGVVIKMAKSIEGFTVPYLERLKQHLFDSDLDEIIRHKDNQVLNQVLNQMVEQKGNLYINEDVIVINNKDNNKKAAPVKSKLDKDVDQVLQHLKDLSGKGFSIASPSYRKACAARIRETDAATAMSVVSLQTHRWKGTDMEEYLHPETIFRKSKYLKYAESVQDIRAGKITIKPPKKRKSIIDADTVDKVGASLNKRYS